MDPVSVDPSYRFPAERGASPIPSVSTPQMNTTRVSIQDPLPSQSEGGSNGVAASTNSFPIPSSASAVAGGGGGGVRSSVALPASGTGSTSRTPHVGQSVAVDINVIPKGMAVHPSGNGGAMVDDAWHGARSSGNAMLPTVMGAPMRKKHIFVEHTNGMFVPQSAHEQIKKAEEQRKIGLMMSRGGAAVGGAGWGEREDAKNFIETMKSIKRIMARLVHVIGAFSFGFCAFQFLNTYADSDSQNASVYLPALARFAAVEQKLMMIFMMLLIILHAFPFAFEFGTNRQKTNSVAQTIAQNQQAKNQKQLDHAAGGFKGDGHSASNNNAGAVFRSSDGEAVVLASNDDTHAQSGPYGMSMSVNNNHNKDKILSHHDIKFISALYGKTQLSPFRHFFSIQFICYIISLVATIVITTVEEGRDKEALLAISDSLLQRIQIAQIVRAAALLIASLASLRQ